ncbi:MAG: hypothetical protein GY861_12470 [bacterium]|nr:hypothetical protein [bacterium]
MAAWIRDVRPMALVSWGRDYHNEIANSQAMIQEDENEIRNSCILADGTNVGED